MTYDYAPAAPPDLATLGGILSHGFGFPESAAPDWFARSGHENLRVLKRGDAVVGGLISIPMGQWFGGHAVPTLGFAGVGISPAFRGEGAATQMMLAGLREARARRIPLSTLYPATVTLYRRAGYERAGARYATRLDLRAMRFRRDPGLVVREEQAVPEVFRALYTRFASARQGFLDRGPYVWQRVWQPRDLSTRSFGLYRGDALEGYVVVANRMGEGEGVITVTDMVAITAAAGESILSLLCDYRSIAPAATWHGQPGGIFGMLLPERHHETTLRDFFMLRVVDPELALAQRGYPRRGAARVSFELDDGSLPECSGTYTVRVDHGKVSVERSTSPARARMSERALAALYAGFLGPDELAVLGMLDAEEVDRESMAWLFGSASPPTMSDMF